MLSPQLAYSCPPEMNAPNVGQELNSCGVPPAFGILYSPVLEKLSRLMLEKYRSLGPSNKSPIVGEMPSSELCEYSACALPPAFGIEPKPEFASDASCFVMVPSFTQ